LTAEINTLTTATNVGSASDSFDRLDSFLLGKSGQPGVNNFRNALRKVRNSEHPESLSSDRAIDALSGILMAILSYSWGITHLELWKRSFHQQAHKDAFILAKHFWRDPNTMQLNRELWNDVANDLEAALKDLE
jgi:hypothetical protein